MTDHTPFRFADPTTASIAQTGLHGRWLVFARLAWLTGTVFAVGTFVSAIQLRYSDLLTLSDPRVVSGSGQLVNSAAIRSNLAQAGLTTAFYATFDAVLNIAFMLGFVAIALVIFARKSDDGMALLVSLTLVTMGASFPNTHFALIGQPDLGELADHLLGSLSFSMGVVTFCLFPDGHFIPSWSKWIALVWVAFAAVLPWLPGSEVDPGTVQYDAVIAESLGVISTIVVAQLYRYRHVSTLKQRQQTKWVVFGVAAGLTGFIVLSLPFLTNPLFYAPGSPAELVSDLALAIFLLFIPSSIGIAILRYRLYDIDLLINRTLVYVPLTAILAGLFAATITMTQKVFVALTGQASDAATVLTTLIVAAVFDPLKTGLQHLVDRRFKEAPDPNQRLRALREQARAVIEILDAQQSMRRLLEDAVPAFDALGGAIYLAHNGDLRLAHTTGEWNGDAVVRVPLSSPQDGSRLGELALGARRNGSDYTPQDRENLIQTVNMVSHAIALSERANGIRG